jgi:hypothetical protein
MTKIKLLKRGAAMMAVLLLASCAMEEIGRAHV